RGSHRAPASCNVSATLYALPDCAKQYSVYSAATSPPSGGEPALDLLEAVKSPEGLAVDDDVRRSEDALGNRHVVGALERVLDRGIVDRGARLGGVDAAGRCDRDRHLGR